MIYAGATHVGCVRKINEDSFHMPSAGERAFIAVADGMGGHLAGEVASKIAMQTVSGYIASSDEPLPILLLREAARSANELIVERGRSDSNCANMGTTLTMALLTPDVFTVANVGDSRAYVLGNGELRLITRDHSLAEELVAAGRLQRDEVSQFAHRNIITRALGSSHSLDVDIFEDAWSRGDRLMICTDGLTTHVEDGELLEKLRQEIPLGDIIDELIQLALSRGGRDNITLVIAQNTPPDEGVAK